MVTAKTSAVASGLFVGAMADGYRQISLGVADDELREGTLDYNAAVREPQAVEAARKEARAAADGSPPRPCAQR